MNGSFTGNINVELLDKKEYDPASTALIAKNEMVHETFTKEDGTIVDTGYRYEGANPKNYVTFNNELWRIIGVFDTVNADTNEIESLVKLIRNENIGDISWDTNDLNNWSEASLKALLNEGEYYNKKNSYGANGLTLSSKEMIQSIVWNLGSDSSAETAEAMYLAERSTVGGAANPKVTTWNGYIGLMYASDYGYAVDSSSCARSTNLWDYSSTSSCKTNNWLFNNSWEWTITPNSYCINYVTFVHSSGYIGRSDNAFSSYGVRPSLYLKSNVSIVDNGNDGSMDHPYELVLS